MNNIPAPDLAPAKILVVDDDRVIWGLTRAAFLDPKENLSELAIAASRSEAEDTIRVFKPDLVLLDLELPDGSGLDLCGAFSKLEPPPVVAVFSADSSIDAQISSYKAGAHDYILKGILAHALRDRVSTQLQARAEISRSSKPSLKTAERKSLFIIEDDPVFRTFCEKALTDVFETQSFANGLSALTRIVNGPPDALLLDLDLPLLSGINLIRQMQDLETLSKIPIVVVSGSELEGHSRKALEGFANVVGYVRKSGESLKDLREAAALLG